MPVLPASAAFIRKPWVKRAALAVVAGVVLFSLFGLFALPPILRHVAEGQIAEQLGRRASIGRIRVNPFSLSVEIDDLTIYESDGKTPFVGFARFYVNAQLSSIYRRAPVVKEVSLEGLRVHLVHLRQTADGFGDLSAYNFSDILARLQAAAAKNPSPPSPPSHEPPRFSINNIRLADGGLVFEDQPTGKRHQIAGLKVGVPFVSTLPVDIDTFVKPELAVTVDGTPFAVSGQTKPFKDSLDTSIALRLSDLDLARYQEYVPLPGSLKQVRLGSGKLTLALDLSFLRPRDGQPTVTVKGQIGLQQVALRRAGAAAEPVLDLASLAVKIGRADLSAMRFQIERVALSGLDVHARRLADGSIDLEHLVPASPAAPRPAKAQAARPAPSSPATAPPAAAPVGFEVGEIDLAKIAVHLRDETVRPAFVETIRDLSVQVKHLSNAPGARADVSVRLTAAPGGTVTQSGTLSLTPFAAAGKLVVDGIEPGRFAPYYRDRIAFDVVSGRVRVGTDYRIATKGGRTSIGLDDAFVGLGDLALARRGPAGGRRAPEDFLRLASLAVRRVKVDLEGRAVQVGTISSRNARLRAARSEAGVLDLTTLVPTPPPSPPHAGPPAAPAPAPGGGAPAETPWTVDVADVDIEGWAARFEDHAVKPKATVSVDGLALRASALSTKPGGRATFDLKLALNQTGKVELAGNAVAEPLALNVRLDLRALKLLPFQPYFRDRVNVVVTDGAVSLKGQAKVDAPPPPAGKRAAAAPPPKVTFAGDLDIADLGTLDGHKNEKLLGWRSFHLGGISVVTEPMAIGVREVKLTDLVTKLVIFPDAHFNLEDVAGPRAATNAPPAGRGAVPAAKEPARAKAPAASAGAPPAPGPRIEIGRVILQNAAIAFTDRSITPNYATELTGLSGEIGKLSTDPQTTAEVALRGAVDRSGALSIEGRVNPLSRDLLVDLRVKVNDFELPPASPYAGRFAGYNIDKGKLSLGLDYHIAGGKLDAQNKLTLDQFTFGDKVASKDAVKLPVKLAVALLKDRHGVIDIDMPLSGSLNDPEFKIGRLILTTLGNLIVKAVTAPFSLIASAFGGGDEESHVDFPAGRADLSAKGATKLQGIGKALRERPGLSFEIEGLADPQLDPAGLRPQLYERKLRAQKRRLIAESGQTPPSGDVLPIEAAERPALVEAAYRRETFAKPRGPDGKEKVLPAAEMEKLILANIRVEADDLRQLALRRAGIVKEALAKASPEATPRLFLINPRTATPGNRVELKLKAD
jgi:hypothetical protein